MHPTKEPGWDGAPWTGEIRILHEGSNGTAAVAEQLEDTELVQELVRRYASMGVRCPLFARKFARQTAKRFANMTRDYILAAPELLQ